MAGERDASKDGIARADTQASAPDAELEFAQRVFSSLQPGVVFDGRFTVERIVGMGGMGCVIAAHHLELDGRVAIKVLRPGTDELGRGPQRLLREARASAKIKSDHVVRVFDVVSSGAFSPYIVMEYLEGESLAKRIGRKRLEPGEAVDFLIQACHALGEAHHLGIVHRDVKPANLFLLERPVGRLKVVDFGISRTREAMHEKLTESHAMLGSPGYMSPEQLHAARDVDFRTDIWSLGVTLHQCLSGELPFAADTVIECYNQILSGTPIALSAVRPDVPPELERVVLRCLQKSPADRFESIPNLVLALHPFSPRAADDCLKYLRALSSQPPPQVARPAAARAAGWTTLGAAASELPEPTGGVEPNRRRVRLWLGVALLGALLSVGGWFLGQSRRTGSELAPLPPSSVPANRLPAANLALSGAPPTRAPEPSVTSLDTPSLEATAAPSSLPARGQAPDTRPLKTSRKPAPTSTPAKPSGARAPSSVATTEKERPPWVESR